MDILELKNTTSKIKKSLNGVTADWILKKMGKSFYSNSMF